MRHGERPVDGRGDYRQRGKLGVGRYEAGRHPAPSPGTRTREGDQASPSDEIWKVEREFRRQVGEVWLRTCPCICHRLCQDTGTDNDPGNVFLTIISNCSQNAVLVVYDLFIWSGQQGGRFSVFFSLTSRITV